MPCGPQTPNDNDLGFWGSWANGAWVGVRLRQIRLVTSAATRFGLVPATAVFVRPMRVAADVRRRTRTVRICMLRELRVPGLG